MVHSHTVHLPLGALLSPCTMCGTGKYIIAPGDIGLFIAPSAGAIEGVVSDAEGLASVFAPSAEPAGCNREPSSDSLADVTAMADALQSPQRSSIGTAAVRLAASVMRSEDDEDDEEKARGGGDAAGGAGGGGDVSTSAWYAPR